MIILTALSGIAILSSPISGDVSQSTRSILEVFVDILAYVPLVMAVLPYRYKLLSFASCCKRRYIQVSQTGSETTVAELHLDEESLLLSRVAEQGDPNEPPGAAEMPHQESTYY